MVDLKGDIDFKSLFKKKDKEPKEVKASKSDTKKKGKQQGVPTPETRFVPGVVGVNLIPDAILRKYQVKGITQKFIVAGLCLIIIFTGVFGAGFALNLNHTQKIRAIEAEVSSLQGQTQSLSIYRDYYQQVETKRQTLGGLMQNEVDLSRFFKDLSGVAGKYGVNTTNVTVTTAIDTTQVEGVAGVEGQPDAAAAALQAQMINASCPSGTPFGVQETGIFCMSFSASADNREALNLFVAELDQNENMVASFTPTTTVNNAEEDIYASGEVTLSVTDAYYSGRYADLLTSLEEVLNPPAEEEPADETEPTEENS